MLAGVALLVWRWLGRLATILVPVGIVADGAFLFGLAGSRALLAGADAAPKRHGFAFWASSSS